MKFKVETVKRKNRLGLKTADFYLTTVLLLITAGLLVLIQFGVKKQGESVVIKVDGNVVKEVSIEKDSEFDIEGYQGGSNHVVIKDGRVCMTDADCPDKLCVHTGTVKKTGETIVCLPHRVVVEITGKEASFDALVQ